MSEPVNSQVATRLEEVSRILEQQGANRYRVRAYRRAAASLRGLARGVEEILRQGGVAVLQELPGIGESLARSIHTLARSGPKDHVGGPG